MNHYYVPKDTRVIQLALNRDHLVLANLTLFSNFLSSQQGVVEPPTQDDTPAGMIVVTLVGYQDGIWIARFPFGMHWGDQGIGYISYEYFDRYNRDRWIVDIDECSEPPEYRQQREFAQTSDTTENTGLLSVHMKSSFEPVHSDNYAHTHPTAATSSSDLPTTRHHQPTTHAVKNISNERRRRVCA